MEALQIREVLVRMQTERVEMPQFKLTPRQAQRLWSLSNDVCEAALAALMGKGFLAQAADGAYVRPGFVPPAIESIGSSVRAL